MGKEWRRMCSFIWKEECEKEKRDVFSASHSDTNEWVLCSIHLKLFSYPSTQSWVASPFLLSSLSFPCSPHSFFSFHIHSVHAIHSPFAWYKFTEYNIVVVLPSHSFSIHVSFWTKVTTHKRSFSLSSDLSFHRKTFHPSLSLSLLTGFNDWFRITCLLSECKYQFFLFNVWSILTPSISFHVFFPKENRLRKKEK